MTDPDDDLDEANPILDALNDADFVQVQTGNDVVVPQADDIVVVPDSSNMPMPRGDFVDERDPAIRERDKNFDFAKNNIKDVMPTIAEAASDTLSIAKMLSSADHASAGAALLSSYLRAQQALVAIEKVQDDLRKRDAKGDKPEVQNQTLNIFAGTTAELQRIMKEMKINKEK